MTDKGAAWLEQRAAERIAPQPGSVSLINAATVQPRSISWLWTGYLARGKFHVLAGEPGTGKTTIAIALAASITCGGRFPDGSQADQGDVLVWSGEDDLHDTLLPRFLAMGGVASRLHFVGPLQRGNESVSFDPASDMPLLRDAAKNIDNLSLFMLDPVVSAVSGDSHKNAETRRSLQPVVDFAVASESAALGISHFTKGTSGRSPIDRVTGSLAFGALPRIVLAAGKVEIEGRQTRILTRAKSNLGPDGGGAEFDLTALNVPGYDIETSCVVWGEQLEGSARELLQSDEPEPVTARDRAADWLEGYLKNGPAWATDVYELAAAEGYPARTLKRAKSDIGARSRKSGDRWEWFLPGYDDPPQGGQNMPYKSGPLDSDGETAPESHENGTDTPQKGQGGQGGQRFNQAPLTDPEDIEL